MSLRTTARAFPTLLRVGFVDAVAYRAEMLVWVLATTMPLVMLALWVSVAETAPVGRYDQPAFVAYFLCTFVVRQLTGSWAFYEMN
ncbi:MAG TPA: ABC transporter permease, partial [Polyangiaceae bacterium]